MATRWARVAITPARVSPPPYGGDDDDCDVPVKQWQSRDAVLRLAAQQGWQVQRLKIDDGCYEIRGTDAQGRAFKAKIDPETLKVLKMKQDDHLRGRERERDRNDKPDNATAPPPSLPPGGAPQGQAK